MKSPITVEATINAPVEKVWESWTKPEHIMKWCQASEDWHAPYADNDVSVGGKFKTTMAARDGSFSFDFTGSYHEVELHKKLAYSIDDGRKVSILFAGDGNKTKVTETFEPEDMNSIEMQQGGWQAILDAFTKYTESL